MTVKTCWMRATRRAAEFCIRSGSAMAMHAIESDASYTGGEARLESGPSQRGGGGGGGGRRSHKAGTRDAQCSQTVARVRARVACAFGALAAAARQHRPPNAWAAFRERSAATQHAGELRTMGDD